VGGKGQADFLRRHGTVTWALRRIRLTWAAWAHELELPRARRCRCGPERRMAAALLDSGAGSRAPPIRSCIILCTVTCKYFISTILSIITQCTGAARDRRTQHDEDQASRVKLANGKHGNTQDDTMILSRSLLAFLVFHSSPPSSWSCTTGFPAFAESPKLSAKTS